MKQNKITIQYFQKILRMNKYFNKSKSIAPYGYEWLCNELKSNKESLQRYILNGYLVFPDAYDVVGDFLENNVGIYRKNKKQIKE